MNPFRNNLFIPSQDGMVDLDGSVFDARARYLAANPDTDYVSELFLELWHISSRRLFDTLGEAAVACLLKIIGFDDDAREFYAEHIAHLSDPIKIYRGGQGGLNDVLKGYSWTLDKEYALDFVVPGGTLVTAELDKSGILLICPHQREIVPNRELLRNIEGLL